MERKKSNKSGTTCFDGGLEIKTPAREHFNVHVIIHNENSLHITKVWSEIVVSHTRFSKVSPVASENKRIGDPLRFRFTLVNINSYEFRNSLAAWLISKNRDEYEQIILDTIDDLFAGCAGKIVDSLETPEYANNAQKPE